MNVLCKPLDVNALKLISFAAPFLFLLSAGCERGEHYDAFIGLLAGLMGGLISLSGTNKLLRYA